MVFTSTINRAGAKKSSFYLTATSKSRKQSTNCVFMKREIFVTHEKGKERTANGKGN
jgi:hypothetical protein